MRSEFDQFASAIDVVLERVLGTGGVRNVSRVTDARFDDPARFADGIDAKAGMMMMFTRDL